MRTMVALTLVVVLKAPARATPDAPTCAPAGADICALMDAPEFVSAYRSAYDPNAAPRVVIAHLRYSFRDAAVGMGQAGPAAVGRQLDAALDQALADVKQRICNGKAAPSRAASAIAQSLVAAARLLRTNLTAKTLGNMTGMLMGSLHARGAICLCSAVNFDEISNTCTPR